MSHLVLLTFSCSHGRRSRGTGGHVPPEFGAGDTNANCPQILSYRYKNEPSKYAQIRFRPGFCPGPHWGSSRRSPRPLRRLERGHPSPYPIPLGTDPPSALAMRPPPRSPARSTPMHVPIRDIFCNLAFLFDSLRLSALLDRYIMRQCCLCL